jgi:dipeptidyl aminopeptidase/acylaminoacyl peptidase
MRIAALLLILAAMQNADAADPPPLEVYGRLPFFSLMQLSPEGTRAAARMTYDDKDNIVVIDVATNEFLTRATTAEVNPRQLRFLNEERLILVAGRAVRTWAVGHDFYHRSAAYSFDTRTNEVERLLRNPRDLYPYQSGLGHIIGRDAATDTIFMPAYAGQSQPALGIYAAKPYGRRDRLVVRGNTHTRDWFLDADGTPLVREDFDDDNNIHQIWAVDERGRDEHLIYELETDIPAIGVVGLSADRKSLVLRRSNRSTGGTAYFLMSIADGAMSGPVFYREGVEVERAITDINRVVYGVEYAGFLPTYSFFDEQLEARVETIQRRLPEMASRLVGWDDAFDKLLFAVEGRMTAGSYLMFRRDHPIPVILGHSRPDIPEEFVLPVEMTEYAARDGMTIPALVTAQEGVRENGNAPLVVLPHGGPEAHDTYGFDWIAQYFASRGYVVLQPQFRGSDGFGHHHVVAGEGEWGRKMQSDIDDGVRFLIDAGVADPERVCIVGASYGGYAALAAGAFSPHMYKCVAAIAPVADLPLKMRRERSEHGRDDWVLDYWESLYGAAMSDDDALRAISPVYHAAAFKAPVLLVHGEKDSVVGIDQSRAMYNALRQANKDVEFVRLEGEDHWLTQEQTRIEALRAIAAFIDEHL